jgi:hypothetical protein
MKAQRKTVRWVVLSTVLSVALVFGVFGGIQLAAGTPSTIKTCTNAGNGKLKLSKTGTCKPDKEITTIWAPSASVHQLCIYVAQAANNEPFNPTASPLDQATLVNSFFLTLFPQCIGHSTG